MFHLAHVLSSWLVLFFLVCAVFWGFFFWCHSTFPLAIHWRSVLIAKEARAAGVCGLRSLLCGCFGFSTRCERIVGLSKHSAGSRCWAKDGGG